MKKLHLICNAHLDPIWQWSWDEGISAVIATFKSAADLADEFDYVFCHGESLLYETIEKHDPELFIRIQNLVKVGKWHITGGWYLQPDCLMPSGETFVRQISVGKAYFKEKFGVEPEVATNYDSFGHSIGLVQIMAKCGYKGYLICRPRKDVQIEYPSRFFNWKAPDGSSIVVSYSSTYNSLLGKAVEKIRDEVFGNSVSMLGSEADGKGNINLQDVDYILWGVGNHGGGPSRKDLSNIKELNIEGFEIVHSTPENLFNDDVCIKGEMQKSLITCMPGCYSSMVRVKQSFRKVENLFYATEKMLAIAKLNGMIIENDILKEPEKKLLLASFHDILPGTCVEEGEKEGLAVLSSCEKSLRDIRTQAFLYLALKGGKAGEGEYPIFVFNYLPYEICVPVEVEFSLADQNWLEDANSTPYVYDEKGQILKSQQIKEDSTITLDWRKRVVFEGNLKPLGITKFIIKTKTEKKIKTVAQSINRTELLSSNSLLKEPIAIESYEDTADPWGMSKEELITMGRNPKEFSLMDKEKAKSFCAVEEEISPVRIIEEGDVYQKIECLYTQGNTNAVLQYKIYKNQPYIDIRVIVEFADKNKLIRLKIPTPKKFYNCKTVGDGPFIWEEKPNTEFTFQKWVGKMSDSGEVFAVINDGVYAGKSDDEYLYLTLIRGVGYCFHPIEGRPLYPQDRYLSRIDCGRYTYNLRLFKGQVSEVFEESERLNNQPYAINLFPTSESVINGKTVSLKGNVILSTMIPKENDRYILRLYNPNDFASEFTLSIGEDKVSDVAQKYEILTVEYYMGKFNIFHDKILV